MKSCCGGAAGDGVGFAVHLGRGGPVRRTTRRRPTRLACSAADVDGHESGDAASDQARRRFLVGLAAAMIGNTAFGTRAAGGAEDADGGELAQPKMVTLPSGIRFIDFRQGTGPTPEWGDVLRISYTTYGVLNGESLVKVDGTEYRKQPYLFKHGGGFTVQGIEEAVHTMRPGGRRRVVVPPFYGYVGPDLGPLPDWIMARDKMKQTLREGGNLVVFDIELINAIKDEEHDRGYYKPMLSPKQIGQWWDGTLE